MTRAGVVILSRSTCPVLAQASLAYDSMITKFGTPFISPFTGQQPERRDPFPQTLLLQIVGRSDRHRFRHGLMPPPLSVCLAARGLRHKTDA